MQQSFAIDGLANVRDLGGRVRSDGSTTPSGVFVRAEQLDRVGPSGWDALWAYGVRTVIDLRRPDERTGDVPAGIRRISVDLDGDERAFWAPIEADGRWGTPLYYRSHMQELPHRLRAVLDAIATAEDGAIVFHCGAGWDRTGLVAATLLRAVSVTEASATADYLASFDNAEAMEHLHGRSFEVDARHRTLARFGHSATSAFEEAYRNLDLDAWFRHAAVVDDTRTAITTWRGAVQPALA